MSVRYYCDGCGKEVETTERLRRALPLRHVVVDGANGVERRNVVAVEVITAVNGTWNAGIVCQECVMRVVCSGEPVDNTALPPATRSLP